VPQRRRQPAAAEVSRVMVFAAESRNGLRHGPRPAREPWRSGARHHRRFTPGQIDVDVFGRNGQAAGDERRNRCGKRIGGPRTLASATV